MRHRPSPELRADLDTSAVDSVLIVGLALALLLGGLVFETRRANDRAAAANAAEQRVRALHRELEERVIARTQKLAEVLRDLDTINLAVSHDLRSPLNAIRLVAGQLEASNRDEVTRQRLEKIAANVARMTAMLNRLLGYCRVRIRARGRRHARARRASRARAVPRRTDGHGRRVAGDARRSCDRAHPAQ